jgi:pyruvate dehydrogenase E2 component (dihydrolipoamide acetyltransferase)
LANVIEVKVPDIGDFKDIPVVEVLVKAGDTVNPEDPLVTLESDKATLEVPSPIAGVVKELRVKPGDKLSEGSVVLLMEQGAAPEAAPAPAPAPEAAAPAAAPAPAVPVATPPAPVAAAPLRETVPPPPVPVVPAAVDEAGFALAHASPSIRRFARELGVDLAKITGTGPKGRIQKEDVQGYVKQAITQPAAAGGGGAALGLLPWPQVDFSKFGATEAVPLSRIKKLAGANLARNWVMIPHVTQHDEADITELEAFRKAMGEEATKQGVRLTLLAFLMKACVAALREFPQFNASLGADGESLVLKKYFNLGVAVDTPDGLVVPVIRDVDSKGVLQLARELAEVSLRARDRKLSPTDLQGGCFSISSLGGIGGTTFTPIINAPEVAILGVSKSAMRPVFRDGQFVPRLMLPMSLSYDHRVIDGAQGARFTTYLAGLLADIRRLVL